MRAPTARVLALVVTALVTAISIAGTAADASDGNVFGPVTHTLTKKGSERFRDAFEADPAAELFLRIRIEVPAATERDGEGHGDGDDDDDGDDHDHDHDDDDDDEGGAGDDGSPGKKGWVRIRLDGKKLIRIRDLAARADPIVVPLPGPLEPRNVLETRMNGRRGTSVTLEVFAAGGPPPNQAPAADAGPDQAVDITGADCEESVTLDGSASSDVDGIIAGYRWTLGGTELASGATPIAVVPLPAGVHTIVLEVTDDRGATATDSLVVTVRDVTAPAIACPGDIVATGDPALGGAIVHYPDPTASDACPGPVPVARTAGPASGSLFPPGTTTVTFAASDAAGNAATCSFDVTVDLPSVGDVFITAITPANASFGDIVEVRGGGFGVDPALVTVVFSFTASDGTGLAIEQPALSASGTSLRVAIPLAPPQPLLDQAAMQDPPLVASGTTNLVRVTAPLGTSGPFPYRVGDLPWDPTPGTAGNEAVVALDDLTELLDRFEAKIEPWFVQSGALDAAATQEIVDAIAAIRDAVALARADILARDPTALHVADLLFASDLYDVEVRARLLRAIAALSGSPIGEILCEKEELNEVLREIIAVLEVVETVVDVIVTTVTAACAVTTIAAIFSLGLASPLAAIVCGGAAVIAIEVLRTIDSILEASITALSAIANSAPTTPIPGTYEARFTHRLWNGEPDFLYVAGTPVDVRSFSDFDKPQCRPSGCDVSFTVDVFEIPVPVSLTIPYRIATDQLMESRVTFPAPVGFEEVATTAEGLSRFRPLDVGAGIERGSYPVVVDADCGPHGVIGVETRSYRVIERPVLSGAAPIAAQLGDPFTACATLVPELAFRAAAADFGDVRTTVTMPTWTGFPDYEGCFTGSVPDTANTNGLLRVVVDGRETSDGIPFAIVPPSLTRAFPDPIFAGEEAVVEGTGFAGQPALNSVTLDGIVCTVVDSSRTAIAFQVPPGTAAGTYGLRVTAVGVHTSAPIPFTVMDWRAGVRVSHPAREAQSPALAVSTSGTAGVVWIDRHPDGGAPDPEVVVSTPAAGFSHRDVAVGSAPLDASIVVCATLVRAGGHPFYTLVETRSTDGGVTFGPATPFAGPAEYLGETAVAQANGRLWRTYVQLDEATGVEPFWQSSITGAAGTWTAPASANPERLRIQEGNFARRPSVSGNLHGAVVAWNLPSIRNERVTLVQDQDPVDGTFRARELGRSVATGGRPSVVIRGLDRASVVWVERLPGTTSGDLFPGAQRLFFNRPERRTFTVPATDLTTVEDEPSLGFDHLGRLHLAWVASGSPREVRYTTTAERALGDAPLGDDPAEVPAPPRGLVALRGADLASTFGGTLVIDPARPQETRWIGLQLLEGRPFRAYHTPSLTPPGVAGVRRPSFLYVGFGEVRGGALVQPGGEARPLAPSPSPTSSLPVNAPFWTADGAIAGTRPVSSPPNTLPKVARGVTPFADFPAIGGSSAFTAEMHPAASRTGRFLAWEAQEADNASLSTTFRVVVFDLALGQPVDAIPDAYYPSWSPTTDALLFVVRPGGPGHGPAAAGASLRERQDGGGVTELASVPAGEDIQWPVYSPDGTRVACMHRSAAGSRVRFLFPNGEIPGVAGFDDTRPVFSPDGQSIVFVRRDPATGDIEVLRYDLATGAVTALTDLPAGFSLGGAEMFPCGGWTFIPGATPPARFNANRHACAAATPVWVEVDPD